MLRKFLHPERIQALNTKPLRPDGLYVAYWVQASQRTIYNHALEYSILRANELKLPLVAFFGLTANYPNANQRPYHFMLEGL
jgi:deoxyribodipyrimidine photo-lyase